MNTRMKLLVAYDGSECAEHPLNSLTLKPVGDSHST